MGTDVFLLTKPAGSNSIQRACSQASTESENSSPSDDDYEGDLDVEIEDTSLF